MFNRVYNLVMLIGVSCCLLLAYQNFGFIDKASDLVREAAQAAEERRRATCDSTTVGRYFNGGECNLILNNASFSQPKFEPVTTAIAAGRRQSYTQCRGPNELGQYTELGEICRLVTVSMNQNIYGLVFENERKIKYQKGTLGYCHRDGDIPFNGKDYDCDTNNDVSFYCNRSSKCFIFVSTSDLDAASRPVANNNTARPVPNPITPEQIYGNREPTCVDSQPIGDGWGWNGQASCQITTNSQVNATTNSNGQGGSSNNGTSVSQEPECRDTPPYGNGWGWNGQESCRVTAINPSDNTRNNEKPCFDSDPVGDGWGWDGSASCRI